jgi:hypothetical protein
MTRDIPRSHFGRDPAEIMQRLQEETCAGCKHAEAGRFRFNGKVIACTFCTKGDEPKCQRGAGRRCVQFIEKGV